MYIIVFVLLGHTLSVQFESHTDIENGRSFAQLDAMDYYEAPKPLIYLAENIVVNDPVETHYYRLKEQQNQCLLNILNFRRDIQIQDELQQQKSQSQSSTKIHSNRNKNHNNDVAKRLAERQRIKEAKLEKLRQEKLHKIEEERKVNTPVMSSGSKKIMKHRNHNSTTLYERHNAIKEAKERKQERLKQIIQQEKMKEMKSSPSINRSSQKLAKRGVNKMFEWEKRRQAKLKKLKQDKIEREKNEIVLPKASKKSKKILLKKKKEMERAQQEKMRLQQQEQSHK